MPNIPITILLGKTVSNQLHALLLEGMKSFLKFFQEECHVLKLSSKFDYYLLGHPKIVIEGVGEIFQQHMYCLDVISLLFPTLGTFFEITSSLGSQQSG